MRHFVAVTQRDPTQPINSEKPRPDPWVDPTRLQLCCILQYRWRCTLCDSWSTRCDNSVSGGRYRRSRYHLHL